VAKRSWEWLIANIDCVRRQALVFAFPLPLLPATADPTDMSASPFDSSYVMARARPALTRSRIMARSNSAKTMPDGTFALRGLRASGSTPVLVTAPIPHSRRLTWQAIQYALGGAA
jgi:hypothetical protein